MPEIIYKAGILRSGKGKNVGSYLEYIATREGVGKLKDGWREKPMTNAQRVLTERIAAEHPKVKSLIEYKDLVRYGTRGCASEFISRAVEDAPEMLEEKSYLDYIATRPRAERFGSHGLFSDEGKTLTLSREREDIQRYGRQIYTGILSLKREDAERLSYNTAERWRTLLRSMKPQMSEAYGIPMEKLKWYAAFHNESYHPHIHIVIYSSDESQPGYLSRQGLAKMKSTFVRELFRDELTHIYGEQTKYRNRLNALARGEAEELVARLRSGLQVNEKLAEMLTELADKLKGVKGKHIYGYLPASVKTMVDRIVDELERDERIKKLYDLWYECRYKILSGYTDKLPPQKPLSQEEAFKPIRNSVIREADKLRGELSACERSACGQAEDKSKDSSSGGSAYTGGTAARRTAVCASDTAKNKAAIRIAAVTRLMKNAADIFRGRFEQLDENPESGVDSRLRREIEAKKKGQNISI